MKDHYHGRSLTPSRAVRRDVDRLMMKVGRAKLDRAAAFAR
jgi:hypothetical protein